MVLGLKKPRFKKNSKKIMKKNVVKKSLFHLNQFPDKIAQKLTGMFVQEPVTSI